jgi:hypothetical protein
VCSRLLSDRAIRAQHRCLHHRQRHTRVRCPIDNASRHLVVYRVCRKTRCTGKHQGALRLHYRSAASRRAGVRSRLLSARAIRAQHRCLHHKQRHTRVRCPIDNAPRHLVVYKGVNDLPISPEQRLQLTFWNVKRFAACRSGFAFKRSLQGSIRLGCLVFFVYTNIRGLRTQTQSALMVRSLEEWPPPCVAGLRYNVLGLLRTLLVSAATVPCPVGK